MFTRLRFGVPWVQINTLKAIVHPLKKACWSFTLSPAPETVSSFFERRLLGISCIDLNADSSNRDRLFSFQSAFSFSPIDTLEKFELMYLVNKDAGKRGNDGGIAPPVLA